jgi:uncharacterized tellurite resistance protein B-like protein
MELTDTLESQLERTREAGASQEEREAVIDLLVMTMYADRFIDDAENTAIERVAEEIDGDDAALPLAQYVNASVAKVRETLDDEGKQRALLEDVSERLGTDRMRGLAYQASRAVATADDEMADEEEQLLSSVRAVFEIRP